MLKKTPNKKYSNESLLDFIMQLVHHHLIIIKWWWETCAETNVCVWNCACGEFMQAESNSIPSLSPTTSSVIFPGSPCLPAASVNVVAGVNRVDEGLNVPRGRGRDCGPDCISTANAAAVPHFRRHWLRTLRATFRMCLVGFSEYINIESLRLSFAPAIA